MAGPCRPRRYGPGADQPAPLGSGQPLRAAHGIYPQMSLVAGLPGSRAGPASREEQYEQDWFPKVRAGLSRKQLQKLGAKLEQARNKAPRSPAQPSALKKTIDAVIA
jgi:hypothetical protein